MIETVKVIEIIEIIEMMRPFRRQPAGQPADRDPNSHDISRTLMILMS
ncbi:MAG: hypothetical protein IK060_02475 [Methanomicrobium sp.]|nr:hypothetical protein [Methanomicrobium sp.]MBR6447070.1 hypothetical protein [Methanomicrobium sp.]MBR6496753.1 hypothetical protein [Methanomicrobium sp.]